MSCEKRHSISWFKGIVLELSHTFGFSEWKSLLCVTVEHHLSYDSSLFRPHTHTHTHTRQRKKERKRERKKEEGYWDGVYCEEERRGTSHMLWLAPSVSSYPVLRIKFSSENFQNKTLTGGDTVPYYLDSLTVSLWDGAVPQSSDTVRTKNTRYGADSG